LAPIMAVCAGLLIGEIGSKHGMLEETRKYIEAFWTLVDEILNAVLFLMIRFEVFAIAIEADFLIAGCMAILLALAAWLTAVATPVLLLKTFQAFSKSAIPIMT
jgi:CPA1 family monovalent cation:H+ antiporter